jgi:plastocyanin
MGPPERFDEYRQLEVASQDGLDNPDYPPDQLAETADAAMAEMYVLDGSEYSPPVFAWRYPPAVTALEFVLGDELGASSSNTIFVGTVLTDSLIRYPLEDDGSALALEGGLADNVDDNTTKGDLGESAGLVVGTGFGVVTDIHLGPDGVLYVVSLSNNAVYAITAGDGGPRPSPGNSPAATSQSSPQTSPVAGSEILIQTDTGTANEFVPAEATATAGSNVLLTFENLATVPHNLTFGPPTNAATATIVQPGSSETLEFTVPGPGDYEWVCTLHPGMEGTLSASQ